MINNDPLIVIVGPTAVGKTEASIEVALRFNGEIVSADSRLLYRGMDIGTAKPTREERELVPHHLIDVAEPTQVWSLAKYQRCAYEAIDNILTQGKTPFLVGGTGQYVKAIVEGWKIPEVKADPALRTVLNNWASVIGYQGIYARLKYLDPEAAALISPQNIRRTIRALEVIFLTGKLFSDQKRKQKPRYRTLILGISRPRPELYERIDERIDSMIKAGFVHEVRELLTKGYSSQLPPLSAIGYTQISEYLNGNISFDDAVNQMKRNTRQFVRRQSNWFKLDDPNIIWFQAGSNLLDEMEQAITNFFVDSMEIT
jgi:tRNA dimethylallyltransferase